MRASCLCWLQRSLVLSAQPLQVEARLLAQTLHTLRQATAPKLGAVQSCGKALAAADPLAFSLLFSSVSSIAGFAGHANYAAANAALDAAAQWQAGTGAPTVAVQWGAWASVGEFASAVAPRCRTAALLPSRCRYVCFGCRPTCLS